MVIESLGLDFGVQVDGAGVSLLGGPVELAQILHVSVDEARLYLKGKKLVDGRPVPTNQVGGRVLANLEVLRERMRDAAEKAAKGSGVDLPGPKQRGGDRRLARKECARGHPRRYQQTPLAEGQDAGGGGAAAHGLTVLEGGQK